MKNAWKEFKGFALGGNMLDLALGFIIGAAFQAVVESLAGDVIMSAIASLLGEPSYKELFIHFGKTTIAADGTELQGGIAIGSFFAQIINFFVLALVLFGMVKVLKKAKLGNFRAQGSRECDFCKEFIPVDAIKCKHCTADIEPIIPD